MRHVADAEGHGHDIKRVVGKGEHFSIGLDDRAREARLKKALGADRKHLVIDVGGHDVASAGTAGKRDRKVAGAAGNVEHLLALLRFGRIDAAALPDAMKPEAEHVVEKVVLGRNAVEDLSNLIGLLVLIDHLVAEIDLMVSLLSGGLVLVVVLHFLRLLSGMGAVVCGLQLGGLFLKGLVGRIVRFAGGAVLGKIVEILLPEHVPLVDELYKIVPAVDA